MHIAQVAPLCEAVPPRLYGGTERVVSWLTEALIGKGHDVTLFASGDSATSAKLVPCAASGLRLQGIHDATAHTLAMLELVRSMADQFDVIHFHIDPLPFPLFRGLAGKTVTTLHGRLDLPDFQPAFRAFAEMPLISISEHQRLGVESRPNWLATVYHGLPDTGRAGTGEGGYLAFLGRISPEKGPDRAIEIARRAGMPLKIAAKVDRADRDYFVRHIEPLLDDPLIEFVGEIDEARKHRFIGDATALLFPIDWCEPFGLVMIEAMALGTPVIARNLGSVPEIIDDGVSGFVVSTTEEAVEAVRQLTQLSRADVRARYLDRFTAERMAEDYVAAYRRLPVLAESAERPARSRQSLVPSLGELAPASLLPQAV
jgi:glycosyltransferase involved in cell wall biosynthesis